MNNRKKKVKSHQQWAWIIIVSFFILGLLDFRFGILGFICMGAPIYHALRGRGKIHCSKYCPRGSFLGRFLEKISMQNNLPKFMRTKKTKNIILAIMLTIFSISVIHTGFVFEKMAFVMLRFMAISFMIGIIMGVFFKPRSWCVVCPMGNGSGLVANQVKNRENNKKQPVNVKA